MRTSLKNCRCGGTPIQGAVLEGSVVALLAYKCDKCAYTPVVVDRTWANAAKRWNTEMERPAYVLARESWEKH